MVTSNQQFTREELEFIRSEMYASLSVGAEHPLFEAVYQKAKAILASPSETAAGQSVRIPTSENEAALMALLGTQWLEQNAPHRLKQPAMETKSTQPPDSRGDAALWVLAWLAMKGGLGSEVHEVIEAVMEGRAAMRPNNKLHIEARGAQKASSVPCCRTWLDTDGETHDPTCNVQNGEPKHG